MTLRCRAVGYYVPREDGGYRYQRGLCGRPAEWRVRTPAYVVCGEPYPAGEMILCTEHCSPKWRDAEWRAQHWTDGSTCEPLAQVDG